MHPKEPPNIFHPWKKKMKEEEKESKEEGVMCQGRGAFGQGKGDVFLHPPQSVIKKSYL